MSPGPDEFKAVFFSPQGEATFHEGKVSEAVGGFDMQAPVWEALMAEPGLRSRLEGWVEQKAQEQVEKELKEKSDRAEGAARSKGFELGRTQALAEAMDSEERLKMICDALIDQTNQVLKQHEKIWMEALSRVLSSFLVDKAQPKLETVEAWINARRDEFLQKGKIVVYLSAADFGASLPFPDNGKWEWRLDTNLGSGQIRAEAEGSGIFFSHEQQWQALEALIDQATRGISV